MRISKIFGISFCNSPFLMSYHKGKYLMNLFNRRKKFVGWVYKMYKFVKKCKKVKLELIQVFHIEKAEKGGKNVAFQNLSTLST